MGKRAKHRQQAFWLPAEEVVGGPGHPFYDRLNALLEGHGFDRFVGDRCERSYH